MEIDKILVKLPYGNRETLPDSRLANVYVTRVARQGLGHTDSDGAAPGNREYKYNNYGSVEFDVPGGGSELNPTDPVPVLWEDIYVRFKY